MRSDSVGMFWQDAIRTQGRREITRTRPPVNSDWEMPTDYPDLSGARMLAVDVETRDDDLITLGPGPRRGGYIVGIAIGTDDGYRKYFPIRHDQSRNLDPDQTLRWASDQLSRQGQPKVGANILYDLDFLTSEGVSVAGPFYDVMHLAALLDEHRFSYSLENLARDWLGEKKVDSNLYSWSSLAFGGSATRKQQAGNIWRCPSEMVGPYAEGDVDLPLRLLSKMLPQIRSEGLERVAQLERELIPMLLAMRQTGVRVDLDRAEDLAIDLRQRIGEGAQALRELVGREISVDGSEDIAWAFERLRIPFRRNKAGQGLFPAEFLKGLNHPIGNLIVEQRTRQKMLGTFIEGYIFRHEINGRVHCEFNQLRSDEYGTVSGRFSSSNPNLQNIPIRDPYWGPLIRGLFIPEEGLEWTKYDYSQIEPRLTLHYATGDDAEEVRRRYQEDPDMDCYIPMMEAIKVLSRGATKTIYLGATYGMGRETMAGELGMSVEEAEPHFQAFHQGAPYIRRLSRAVGNRAASRGYIRTLLGRRARFPFWESRDFATAKKEGMLADREKAVAKWGRVRRAMTHKALNRLIQGGAADIMKLAMLAVWDEGRGPLPHLTVHDELDFSTESGDREARRQMREKMEGCVELRVPLRVSIERGSSWGDLTS